MASTYLTRTPSSSGNRKTFTISTWVKRSKLTTINSIFDSPQYGGSGQRDGLRFENATDTIRFFINNATAGDFITNAVFRDTSAWYHIVVSVDTTQATSTDRVKIYVNGEQPSLSTATYPSQNQDLNYNLNQIHYIGAGNGDTSNTPSAGEYFDGSMAHFHFIDGTAYAASDFGETDATTGIWKPKTAPSVTYGSNGFFLKMENSGSMGTDSSGNANNFTVNGTMTQTLDTPSNVFATMNPLDTYNSPTITNGNTVINAGASDKSLRSTLGASAGKWYWEVKTIANNGAYVGIINSSKGLATGYDLSVASTNSVIYNANGGDLIKNGSSVGTYTGGSATYGFALDLDAGTLKLSKDGVFFNSGNAVVTGITSDTYLPLFAPNGGGSPTEFQANFGNGYFGTTAVSSAQSPSDGIGIFEYTPPTGYKALCTKSINAQEYA